MIEYQKNCRIEASTADLLVNTVNTVGVMGAGVALAMKKAFPEIMEPYKEACDTKALVPGVFQVLPLKTGQKVINLATKNHWKNPSQYSWVGAGLVYLNRYIMESNAKNPGSISSILLPPPGCGHGGLDWGIVNRMIHSYLAPAVEAGLHVIIPAEDPGHIDGPVYYAGIGARATPDHQCGLMRDIAAGLSDLGYTMRSGGAAGADTAFEEGVDRAGGKKQIFLAKDDIPRTHIRMALNFHPSPDSLRGFVLRLMARNTSQVFGDDFTEPSSLIICWTPKGAGQGGTGQALRMAKSAGIPILDLGDKAFEGLDASRLIGMAGEKIAERQAGIRYENKGEPGLDL